MPLRGNEKPYLINAQAYDERRGQHMDSIDRGISRREILGLAVGAAASAGAMGTPERKGAAVRRLLLIAGTQSHPPMMHEYNAGVLLLKQCLDTVPGLETRIALSGWPKDDSLFDGVNAVFLYMDGGSNHYALRDDRPAKLAALMAKGVGLGCCHYAVEIPEGADAKRFQSWIG